MDKTLKTALLGTGLMGAPIAENLLKAGFTVNVWNRSGNKADKLSGKGAKVCQSPQQAVRGISIVILMLSDAAAVDEVLFRRKVAATLSAGAIVIDMSSIPPESARNNAQRLNKMSIHYLDTPVSGGTVGAEDGTLTIFAGGRENVFHQCLPVFEPMGNAHYMGPSGAGQMTKLTNQIIVAITIGAVAEGLLFAAAGGVDPGQVREALIGGFADSRVLALHGERMLKRDFLPGGPNRLFLKDIETAFSSKQTLAMDLPLFNRVLSTYREMNASGMAEYDHSSLLLALEQLNPQYRLSDAIDKTPPNHKE